MSVSPTESLSPSYSGKTSREREGDDIVLIKLGSFLKWIVFRLKSEMFSKVKMYKESINFSDMNPSLFYSRVFDITLRPTTTHFFERIPTFFVYIVFAVVVCNGAKNLS